ncbi:hypothetical protein KRMM14A1004_39370 [Krasilnikovia sp. MM14-A1004]
MAGSKPPAPGAGRGGGGRRPRGALEREILGCLTSARRPLTPGEVLDSLGEDLAYTTVMTTLARMFEKGLTVREVAGRAYAYSAAPDPRPAQAIAVATRMHRLLMAGDDHAGVLAHFVADLGPEDERLLSELLADLRSGGDTNPGTGGKRARGSGRDDARRRSSGTRGDGAGGPTGAGG